MQTRAKNLAAALSTFQIAALALTACGDTRPTVATTGGARLSIAVAPLTLPGLTDACYNLSVANGGGQAVWSETNLCAADFGDSVGSLSYVGPCDASLGVADNKVTLEVVSLHTALAPAGLPADAWVNPCPVGADRCVQVVPCRVNADAPVVFDIAIMRDAGQGFFDVAVNFDDIFCSAKLDCLAGDLLANPNLDPPARDTTLVLGFACTAGTGDDTVLHMDDVRITCGPPGSRVVIASIDPSDGPGNFYDAGQSPSPFIFQVASYMGKELFTQAVPPVDKLYWNLALGVEPGSGFPSCVLTTQATASDGMWDQGESPASAIWPVIELAVPLTGTTGALTCGANGLDDPGSFVTTSYTPLSGETFCHYLDAQADGTVVAGSQCGHPWIGAGTLGGFLQPEGPPAFVEWAAEDAVSDGRVNWELFADFALNPRFPVVLGTDRTLHNFNNVSIARTLAEYATALRRGFTHLDIHAFGTGGYKAAGPGHRAFQLNNIRGPSGRAARRAICVDGGYTCADVTAAASVGASALRALAMKCLDLQPWSVNATLPFDNDLDLYHEAWFRNLEGELGFDFIPSPFDPTDDDYETLVARLDWPTPATPPTRYDLDVLVDSDALVALDIEAHRSYPYEGGHHFDDYVVGLLAPDGATPCGHSVDIGQATPEYIRSASYPMAYPDPVPTALLPFLRAYFERYRAAMQDVYGAVVEFHRAALGGDQTFQSWGDAVVGTSGAVMNGDACSIGKYTWQDWTSNWDRRNPLMRRLASSPLPLMNGKGYVDEVDFTARKVDAFSDLYAELDWLSVSGYFYDRSTEASRAATFFDLIFNLEVNQAIVGQAKRIFAWVEPRYIDIGPTPHKYLSPGAAQAIAIMPFFAGADGLWLWDNTVGQYDVVDDIRNELPTPYHYFVYGLWRLSEFNHYFDGDYQLTRGSQDPITTYFTGPGCLDDHNADEALWRGVYNPDIPDRLLVAAFNPFASARTLTLEYASPSGQCLAQTITVAAESVWLSEHQLATTACP